MRIALLTPGFSADEQDWCIPALLNLVRELARDHEVHVFTLRYPHRCATYDVYGATVHTFGGADVRGVGRFRLLQRVILSIRRIHREEPFDVIHAFWADEPGFVAVTSGRLTGAPATVSVMGGELVALPDIGYGGQLGRVNRWLTRVAIRGATRVTVGSRYLEGIVHAHAPAGKCDVLPLGVDTGLFASCDNAGAQGRAPLQGDPAILSVGSLVPVKDHATLIRAMAPVTEELQDAQLHLVGNGPLRENLEQLAASIGLADRVTFHGEVAHDRLPDYDRAADLLVVSSRYESQCMVALEAAACGCPVIGTAVGVLPEISPASAQIPAGDAMALSRGIIGILKDDAKCNQLSDNALDLVRTQYALDLTVPRLLTLYAELSGAR